MAIAKMRRLPRTPRRNASVPSGSSPVGAAWLLLLSLLLSVLLLLVSFSPAGAAAAVWRGVQKGGDGGTEDLALLGAFSFAPGLQGRLSFKVSAAGGKLSKEALLLVLNANAPQSNGSLAGESPRDTWSWLWAERARLAKKDRKAGGGLCGAAVAAAEKEAARTGQVRVVPLVEASGKTGLAQGTLLFGQAGLGLDAPLRVFLVADCGSTSSAMSFDYDLEAVNVKGDLWEKQVSFERWSVAQQYVAWFLAFTLGAAAHAWAAISLWRIRAYHVLVRILILTWVMAWISVLFAMSHYLAYRQDGIGAPAVLALSDLLDAATQLTFMFLLILIAKGWTISSNSVEGKKWIAVAAVVAAAAYLSMYLWHWLGQDPVSAIYIYDTVPGLIIVGLRTVFVAWFLWTARVSHLNETAPHKRKFFVQFGVGFALWFICLPIIVLLGAVLPADARFKVVQGLYLASSGVGMAAMTALLWPTRIQKYFTVSGPDLLLGGAARAYDAL